MQKVTVKRKLLSYNKTKANNYDQICFISSKIETNKKVKTQGDYYYRIEKSAQDLKIL